MRNTCAQSGLCHYCGEYIERMTPVQFWETADYRKVCQKSRTGRHVLTWLPGK